MPCVRFVRALSLLVLATLLLGGCGFHLRGKIDVPDELRAVAVRDVSTESSNSWFAGGRNDLQRAVNAAFTENGFVVTDDAPIKVDLVSETLQRSIASIAASASAAEYQVDYAVEFRITAADGSALVRPTTLRTDRSYRYHEDAVMGSAEEEALLYRDLRRDIAEQVVRQYRRSVAHRPATASAVPPAPAPAPTADAPAP